MGALGRWSRRLPAPPVPPHPAGAFSSPPGPGEGGATAPQACVVVPPRGPADLRSGMFAPCLPWPRPQSRRQSVEDRAKCHCCSRGGPTHSRPGSKRHQEAWAAAGGQCALPLPRSCLPGQSGLTDAVLQRALGQTPPQGPRAVTVHSLPLAGPPRTFSGPPALPSPSPAPPGSTARTATDHGGRGEGAALSRLGLRPGAPAAVPPQVPWLPEHSARWGRRAGLRSLPGARPPQRLLLEGTVCTRHLNGDF